MSTENMNHVLNESISATSTATGSCACGQLKITVQGSPFAVYACSCFECQRVTGTAFAYRARFPKQAIAKIEGDIRTWRRTSDAGRWVEHVFCATCGSLLYMNAEAIPDEIAISLGCFSDRNFAPPTAFYHHSSRPAWCPLPEGIRLH